MLDDPTKGEDTQSKNPESGEVSADFKAYKTSTERKKVELKL
ncbi:hypothetical protein [uncultured Olegusella sp.]|nr:hypothetical protein [uncultured Olegusella sp.]